MKTRRIVLSVLAVLAVFGLLLLTVESLPFTGHECCGEACQICLFLNTMHRLLESVTVSLLSVAVVFCASASSYKCADSGIRFCPPPSTLYNWKVKLSD